LGTVGPEKPCFEAILIGGSAGGFKALKQILPAFVSDRMPGVIIAMHRTWDSDDYLETALDAICPLKVRQVDPGAAIDPGAVFVAPPNYHLLIEDDRTFALSIEHPVNYARPSIDVLFESAAEVFEKRMVGVILTGANNDGSKGLERVKHCGGMTVVQDPTTAETPSMPSSAIRFVDPDHILPLHQIGPFLGQLRRDVSGAAPAIRSIDHGIGIIQPISGENSDG